MNTEIEARFLEVNKRSLVSALIARGATDLGEVTLNEIIFYDKALTWSNKGRVVRLRSSGNKITLTYKENKAQTVDSAREIEFDVSSLPQAKLFLETVGLQAFRHQEKRRHSLQFGDVTIDIDTWPNIPTYAEFEGPSEAAIRAVAESVGYAWTDAVFDDARVIIEQRYNVPVSSLRWFTFERCE